ncbi:MAG TPA: fibronectin type III domain-containing protein, partial [Acidothermaceae bacterium]|nr:fibronectin type III domain-containing protein [Acidothermaceae bacterium]
MTRRVYSATMWAARAAAHQPRSHGRARVVTASVALVVAAAGVVALPVAASAAPSTVTANYGYTGSTSTFTVPAGITAITVTLAGGEGGQGGADAAGPSPAGGYQGVVTGTMTVTPGQVLMIGVGQGGATGTSHATGSSDPAQYTNGAAVGGANPLGGYAGGNGGVAGFQGSSGFGGGGGAATVIVTNAVSIIAGGAGGAGGSGQYAPTLGRVPYSTFTARPDVTSTSGEQGITVATVCNNAPSPGCDGGGGGAGGGGAQGGQQGDVQFGSGTSDEWYGYGGYPGANSTGGVGGLTSSYQYYSDDAADGSVAISYTTGAPGAPTAVSGVSGDTTVALSWTAPTAVGESAVSDYIVQYALASDPTAWTTFDDGISTATSTTVSGLTDDTAYVFQVSAVNTAGTGAASATSGSVTPLGVPSNPTITAVTALDGALSLAFVAPSSGSTPTNYAYQLNGAGPWIATSTTTSPMVISGLANGTLYSVQIRADSAVGAGGASPAATGTPEALPGAPSISSTSTGIGSATISFTPGYSGGGTITDYQYQLDAGTWTTGATTTSPLTITGLSNATTYAVAIRAVTGSGAGAASASTNVTTPATPAAPTLGSITAGDTTLSIPFTPGSSGGSSVTSYQYQLVTSGAWATASSASSPIVVSGLTNGTTYQVSVRAVNAVGDGTASTAQAATPATVPDAPSIIGNTVAGSDLHLSAAFTAPSSNGGSAIIDYDYSTDAGATWLSAASTTSPIVISALSADGTTALVNGTTYDVELRAVNTIGAGLASAVATGIAATTASAPTISGIVAGPSSLTVTFAPASNGGAAITGYQYQLGSSGWIDTGTLGSNFLIPGLTNGTTYGVTVRAINSQGNGSASSSVNGTPVTTPAQPTISGVTRGNQTLTVAVADADNGGSAITSWQYSTDAGSTWFTAAATTTPLTITALSTGGSTAIANGTSYPVAVRAVNAAGASAASAITGVGPSTTPVAPTVALAAGNASIEVSFAVADNGGSPVTAVEYQLNGGSWANAGTVSSPFDIGALTNGTLYTLSVRADNALGTGDPSSPASATPSTVPDAPTAVAAVSDTASADVSWTAPGDNGGSTITGYVASAFATPSSPSPVATCATAGTACSITGLTDATTYYISVVAQNAAGSSLSSTPQVSVTPLARPGSPTLNSLTPGDSILSLAFTAGSAGTDPITGYQYQLNGGSWLTASSSSSPLVVSGLTNGTSYVVALRAVSAAGTGVASSTLTATPFTYPNSPDSTTIVANGQNASIVATWLAPNDNGSPITGYTATAFSAATAGTQITTCSTSGALTCTLTGLTNGTTYYVSLQALNSAGLSARSDRVAATPSLYPSAVSNLTATPGNGQVALTWAPGSTGASAITDYTLWSSTGGAYTQFSDVTAPTTSATVTGLTNGTAYTFETFAVNSNGPGPGAISAAVTPATVPDAPAIITVVPGNTSATATWTAPVNDGGAPITGYVLTPSIGVPVTVGNVLTGTVTGLTNGTAYTITVAAINSAGTGAQSSASSSVTPLLTAPGAPAITTATPANTQILLTWTAPTDTGGDPITGYLITPSVGSPITVGAVTTYAVAGLTNGTAYTFTVAAINDIGTGTASAASSSATPLLSAPEAPTLAGVTGDSQVVLTWTPPTNDGGDPITGYIVTPSVGSPVTLGAVTTYTATGLTNDVSYNFTVAAVNMLGTGIASASVAVMPHAAPAPGGSTGATPTAPLRLGGADRFATAVATSAAEFTTSGSADAVVIARSDAYPDALVGATLAAAKNAPLLFADGATLPADTVAEIQRVLPIGGTVYLLGGTATVPTTVATTIHLMGYVPVRCAGADRYGTALAVAAALGNPSSVVLATGTNFPDALSAGP